VKKKNAPIIVKWGNTEFLKLNASRYDWRDTYHQLLTLTWPRFAGVILVLYVVVNLLFAGLYLIGGDSIAEMPSGSFSEAFFFSVETLATVGYGHMYPATLYGHLAATLEIMVGMFGMAVVTGLIFIRFARPTARIEFSKTAVVSNFDGVPTLAIRVANLRHHPMIEAEFKMTVSYGKITAEGEEVRLFFPLNLIFNHLVNFPVAITIRHPIDEKSPLYGLTPNDFEHTLARLFISVVCVDPVIASPVYVQHHYTPGEIEWNRQFVEMYFDRQGGGYSVDYGKLSNTEPAASLISNIGPYASSNAKNK
jgi:inward rectifier potassium channel